MTEVPEHLLRRSKERRAALGLGGGDAGDAPSEGAAAAPAAAETTPAPAAAAPAEAAPAAAPAAPAPVEEVTPYVEPVPPRRIPMWVYPVLAVLPFWAFVYFGAFGSRVSEEPADPMVLGEQVYQEFGCGGCHGADGGGGVGPALADGESVKTFPDEADHAEWIRTGSAPFKGQPYGDPNREGGQRIAETGGMPGFAGDLSEEEIEAVVRYEREGL